MLETLSEHIPYQRLRLVWTDCVTSSACTTCGIVFRRSRRPTQRPIIPRVPTRSAIEDTVLHYEQVFSSHLPPPQIPRMDMPPPNHAPDWFTTDAVRNAIIKYPAGKSPGADGIPNALFVALLNSSFPKHLSQLYGLFFQTGFTPPSWNISTTHPVPKIPTSQTITDFRPISMTLQHWRIFESVIYTNLPESLMTFDSGQGGFRKGFSTATQAILSDYLARSGKSLGVFLDIKAAYDSVQHNSLFTLLRARNPLPYLFNTLISLFTNCSTKVIVNGVATEPIRLSRRILQGPLLSPWLFNVFIDGLATTINSTRAQNPTIPRLLLFADDITIRYPTGDIQSLLAAAGQISIKSHSIPRNAVYKISLHYPPYNSRVACSQQSRSTNISDTPIELTV